MKKKIGYLLLIIISIFGSRLIFGRDYHLNSDNLKEENLYVYSNIENNKVLATYVLDEDFYYVVKLNKTNQYTIVKYDLINDRKDNEYTFNSSNELVNVQLFKQNNYMYLTSNNSDSYIKFDSKLNTISNNGFGITNINNYGIFNDKTVYTVNNEIYYDSKLYATVPISCGKSKEIIYDRDTYVEFYNENTGFGCLYNLNDKKIEYLDYENARYVKNKLLEYQSNRLSFKYDGSTYYFDDITESNNLKMHNSGDYLFTIDSTNNKLRIYNIESRKIIYEKVIPEIKGKVIDNIMIDDYVFFTLTNNGKTDLYVWDYLKETRRNYDMISYNEKEYKFKNNELKEEIKNTYNIDVYIYDQAVDYFDKYYVVPSYDDILINSRLITLKDVLGNFNQEEVTNISKVKIFFDKNILSSNQGGESNSIMVKKDSYYIYLFRRSYYPSKHWASPLSTLHVYESSYLALMSPSESAEILISPPP